MASSSSRRLWVLPLVAGGMAAAFAGGRWVERREAERRNEWADARLLSSAVDSVRVHALDSLPSDELIRRAVAGMLRELHDPYAALLRPDGYERYRGSLQGEGKGLGLQLRRAADGATVASVVPGSPAALAGVRAGDRILLVDGVPTGDRWGRPADSTVAPPTQHQLTVWRATRADTLQLVVTRRAWHAPAVAERGLLTDSVGYVRLSTMSAQSADELETAVEALVDRGARSLLLDLRGNIGGLFEEGVKAAGLFLPRGVVVASLAGRGGEAPQPFRGRRSRWPLLPLTVLVDGNTASAAEVVAVALRQYDRALLVGTPTYGKGLVQRVVRLSPELSLRLTTARWLTPRGEALERRQGRGDSARGGLLPDVTLDDFGRRDVALTPSGWPMEVSRTMRRTADSVAVRAVRDGWATQPLSLLEARLQSALAPVAPRSMREAAARAEWVTETMRIATVQVLEMEQQGEALLRYRARHDAALRAGLDVLAPGTDVASGVPTALPALTGRRTPTMP